MYDNKYGNLFLFFITSICGIIMICNFAKGLQENKFLVWIGQNSIIIYVLHFKLINLLHFIGKKIFPQLAEINYSYPANWHYFIICILILIPVVYICNRWLGIFFGKGLLKGKPNHS